MSVEYGYEVLWKQGTFQPFIIWRIHLLSLHTMNSIQGNSNIQPNKSQKSFEINQSRFNYQTFMCGWI